ncbi:MAG: M48 family metallopeptidase [Pseudomonadales bacterium]|nr:M48 family metallopeptidase [Pseudomonadales bacterium]
MPSRYRLVVGLIFLQGCGVTYQLPIPPSSTLIEAANEIRATPTREPVTVTLNSAEKRLGEIERRLQPATQELCLNLRERASADCRTWQISIIDEDEINAYATGTNDVVVHRGVIEYAQKDDEIALVVAHELSHHLLNHLNESAARNILGSLIGAAVATTIGGASSGNRDAGAEVGSWIANQSFSRAQEKEADIMAGRLLFNAGYSLTQARSQFILLAQLSDHARVRSTFLDAHPVGPERLAHWDMIIEGTASN